MKKDLSLFISFNGERGYFKELYISSVRLKWGLAGILLLGLLLAGFAIDYVFLRSFGDPKHQKENKALKNQLAQVLSEMEQLHSRLYQIEDFSHKIKVIAGLKPVDPANYAIGGGPLSPVPFSSLPNHLSLSSNTRRPASPKEASFLPVKEPAEPLSPSQTKPKKPFLRPEQGDYIRVYMDRLDKKSHLVREDISQLMTQLYEKQDILNSTPTIMPAQGWISSHFGYRQYPFTGEVSLHEGMDIASFPGSPVHAPGAGVVMFAGYKPGYGKVIVVDHGYQLSTLYGHLSEIMVNKWQKVKRGQVMGAVGNTGNSSGPHLHYEVRISNVPVDPAHYILNNF